MVLAHGRSMDTANRPVTDPRRLTGEFSTQLRVATRRGVVTAGAAVLVCGLSVLAGWAIGRPVLSILEPAKIAMVPNAAIAFVASGAALILLAAAPDHRFARVVRAALALFVLMLGTATVLERLLAIDFGIDLLLFEQAVRNAPWSPPGRMALNSAVSFTLSGIALLLLDTRTARNHHLAQFLALATFFIAFLGLLGYAYGVNLLYTMGQASGGMALLTAFTFTALSLGAFLARADSGLAALITNDRASGLFSRRLAPAAILVPVAVGWLLLAFRRAGWVDDSVGIALFVVTVFGLYLLLLIRSARAVDRLDREREELLEESRRAREDAEAANRAKMQFLTSMSHELRTPLNAIAGYVQLLEIGVHGPVTEAQLRALERTRRSQQHLLALINDVLNFAKLDAGRVEFRVTTVGVHDVLNTLEALVLPQLAAKSLQFTMSCDDPLLALRADREKLQQILINLLSNAIKFTPDGGTIALACSANDSMVRVTVRDTGVGIAPEALDTIFEPFVQVDRSLTNLTEGAGLGLAISRELARGMGGELVAESVPGEGSTFTLTMPLAQLATHPGFKPDEGPLAVR
jgi:signal transduction histidine kinase